MMSNTFSIIVTTIAVVSAWVFAYLKPEDQGLSVAATFFFSLWVAVIALCFVQKIWRYWQGVFLILFWTAFMGGFLWVCAYRTSLSLAAGICPLAVYPALLLLGWWLRQMIPNPKPPPPGPTGND